MTIVSGTRSNTRSGMSIRNHANLDRDSLWNETRNEIDVRYGRNKDCFQNQKFHLRT